MTESRVEPVHGPLGPVMLDVLGAVLSDEERERLCDPLVGGVILFARNFVDGETLQALTGQIHALRDPPLIIAVDHEGGRVQRFRSGGFTVLPSMRIIGSVWNRDYMEALEFARCTGFVLAAELLAHGVDLSFTPVLDLDYGGSRVIGDRAFHRDPRTVARLAGALAAGMAEAGMGCVGKHFPGHGHVEADSHHEIPVDDRSFDAIWKDDLAPYRHRMSRQLAGVMPAHVIYREVDERPAGFSPFWLQEVLRKRIGFSGVVFSDDLTMEGASVAGDILARAKAALAAGCDMVLVCNRPDLAADLLDRWVPEIEPQSRARIEALRPQPRHARDPLALELSPAYQQARRTLVEALAKAI